MNFLKFMSIFALLMVFSLVRAGQTANDYIRAEVINHNNIANQIELGSQKAYVLPKLLATQYNVAGVDHRNPDKFIKDGKRIEIYYFRSAWYSDGLLTDDEFTPYVFIDGILSGIGWSILGGPKTRYNAAAAEYKKQLKREQNQRNWNLIDKCSAELLAGTRNLSDGCF